MERDVQGQHLPDLQVAQDDQVDSSAPVPVPSVGARFPVPGGALGRLVPRRHLRWMPLLSILGGIFAIGLALWWWLSPTAPPTAYKTATVDRGPISAMVTATGTVNPIRTVQVGSQVSGKIQALFADFNSVVSKGQLIAQIDPAPFRTRVIQARANLGSARGNFNKARNLLAQRKLELDRMVALRQQQFVAQSDLDLANTNYRDAQAQLEIAQAQVDQTEAALANAELDLGYTKIYSPVDGIVISRNVDVGQTVAASFQTPTLFLIAQDLTRMQVNANVSEADIGGLAEGKRAEFSVDAFPNESFKAVVAQVRNAPINIQNVVTYDVVLEVDNRELKLKPGMTANVSILTAQKDAVLRVPNAALRFKPAGAPADRKEFTVWLETKDQPRPVSIRPGVADSAFTEVERGELREGDRVIIGLAATAETTQQGLPPGFGMGPRFR
jgi:HlyD family secretion protein